MTLADGRLEALDRDVEAVLGVPITPRSIALRRRRNGLLIALPLSLGIGAITAGIISTDSPLTAIEGSSIPETRVARDSPSKPDAPPAPAQIATRSAAGPPRMSPLPVSQPTPRRTVSTPAPAKARAPAGDIRESPVDLAAASAPRTAIEPAAPENAPPPVRPTVEKRDANTTYATEKDSRLETIDAIRALRLQ